MKLDELEAALRVMLDREAIAIYPDPHGELVAIELRIDDGEPRGAARTSSLDFTTTATD